MKKIKNKKNDLTLSKANMIIHSPIITEKSTKISEFNQFIFRVDIKATSKEIKIAIEKLFKVKVKKVNTQNVMGKYKNFKGTYGRRVDIKKAIVTLEHGNLIDMSASK